jgi:predicted secreted hydrolase
MKPCRTTYCYFLLVVFISGCTLLPKYKNLDSSSTVKHQTPNSNWKPKDSKTEWWYASGKLTDENGGLYFYQFTIFHTVRLGAQLYITHIAISDYQAKERFFEEKIYFPLKKYKFTHDTIQLGKNIISLKDDQIIIDVDSKNIKFNLTSTSTKPAVWHGKDGVISMGNPDKPNKNSYYYSFTNMNTTGSVSFINKKGERINLNVEGNTWFDRQWGEFAKETWDWFSLRFDDGEEVMFYSFPDTDYKTATFITKDGSAILFNDFNYNANKFIKFKKTKIGHGWCINMPFKEQEYTLEPLCENDVNSNIVHDYWEGLCKILNSNGEFMGWAVVEVTE